MKKRLLAILLSALMVANISACSYQSTKNTNFDTLGSNVSDSDNQMNIPINISSITEQSTYSSGSIYEMRKTYFNEQINNNPYDTWLDLKKAEGTLAEKVLYKSWLDFWSGELYFTIKAGETHFLDENDYLAWKTNLEEWVEVTQENLRIEMNNMIVPSSLAQARLIHHTGEIIRQKVIDTKYFLYKGKCDKETLTDSTEYQFPIEWAINSNF